MCHKISHSLGNSPSCYISTMHLHVPGCWKVYFTNIQINLPKLWQFHHYTQPGEFHHLEGVVNSPGYSFTVRTKGWWISRALYPFPEVPTLCTHYFQSQHSTRTVATYLKRRWTRVIIVTWITRMQIISQKKTRMKKSKPQITWEIYRVSCIFEHRKHTATFNFLSFFLLISLQ